MKYLLLVSILCASATLLASDQSQYYREITKLVDSKVFEIQAVYHIGDVVCGNKTVSVVAVRKVIKGMMSPRGAHCIYLFDGNKLVGVHEEAAFPLRCEGTKVIFYGEIHFNGNEGCALDFSDGFENRKVIN